jgi:hypothetical protein
MACYMMLNIGKKIKMFFSCNIQRLSWGKAKKKTQNAYPFCEGNFSFNNVSYI